jgi:ligand-binding sensor domain-containing protein/two-component sensor histidine kinase
MQFKYFILFILIFELSGFSNAQEALRFNHLRAEDGLPDNTISCMLQDSSGFIWIGTSEGLAKYDGNTITKYAHDENDSASLCNSRINCLYEDNLHNIWIGTYFGLSRFDPVKNNFKNYYFDKGSSNVSSSVVSNVMQDNKGMLWVGTGTGIYKTEIANPQFSLVKSISEDHYGWLIHGMASSASGRIFILMDTALLYTDDYGKYFKTVVNYGITEKKYFTELYYDKSDEHLWFGIYGSSLVYELDAKSLEYKKYLLEKSANQSGSNIVFNFCRLNDSIMMAGCLFGQVGNGGVVFLNTKRNSFRNYIPDKEDPSSLSEGNVTCIMKDCQNTFWIGTNVGINSFNLRQLNFHWLSTGNLNLPGLQGFSVRQLCYDKMLWIGTAGYALAEYKPEEHSFSWYQVPLKGFYLSHGGVVFSMYPDKDTLWLGMDGGFMLFDINKHKYDTLVSPPPELKELYTIAAKGIGKDTYGSYWFGTYNKGIFSYNPSTGKGAHYLNRDTNLTSKHRNYIRCMSVDAEGNKWAGTYEDGFYRMDAGTNQINWNIPGDKEGIVMQRGWINYMYCDKTGNTYIATRGGGLVIYDGNTKIFRTVKNTKWPEDNKLNKIVEVEKGVLWLATGKGLSCWDLNKGTFLNYPEGTRLSTMQNVAGCASPDGTIYFAGDDVILYFAPGRLNETSPYIHPEITSVSVMNKNYTSDITKPLSLGYKDNYVSFAFSAFDFLNEKGDQFAYKLEGLDNDWNYCGNRHYVEYTSLQGGDYTFKLKVQNADGVWIETKHPVHLHIATPYWKTWWFIMLCGLAFFALGYLFYYLRIQRKLEAEKIRKDLARDLHDDIGSSLSSISMLSEMAGKNTSNSPEESQFIFNKISESSHKTMESMKDIVWTVNPENDAMDALLTRMRIYCSEMLEPKGIECDFRTGQEVEKMKLPMEQRRNFYLFFKEAINNIAKYSQGTKVVIAIWKIDEKIEIKITDNGIGFNTASAAAKGNGLKNMNERAKLMHGTLAIESKEKEGTKITLIFPIT